MTDTIVAQPEVTTLTASEQGQQDTVTIVVHNDIEKQEIDILTGLLPKVVCPTSKFCAANDY